MNINSDSELLKGLYKGEVSSFKSIYDRYFGALYQYSFNILKKRAVCEDIVQEIFISLWTRREKATIKQLKPYLFQAVKHQIFNHFRANKFTLEDLTRLNIIDLSMNISRDIEFDELEQLVRSTVVRLPKRCRHIFILSRYQHKSNKEIAEELEISVQAVKNQISKALTFLKANLQYEEIMLVLMLFYR
ncbi:RNA polymerase sigma-70 factor (ECF subfamily) [Flavobacteriaceae bacterium MAR_2009_75]|nr:RNA polymerase sigma-70 factor (ECF subfamily) [Flavobacteriaceae bacterium MAR_2009_75]